MAKAVCDSQVETASTRWRPIGLESQARRLSTGAILMASCSTGEVKPKALKREPESSVCFVSHASNL